MNSNMENKTIFAIVCNVTPELHNVKFFTTKTRAETELKNLAAERKSKLGVHCFEQTNERFSFLLGWEERKIIFSIVELPVQD